MGFTVNLYTHYKRDNSTKRPSNAGAIYSCVLKKGCGILHPAIELNMGLTYDPSQYNYAYIPAFDRYYYIEEWLFEDAKWTAQMRVDVLATYKGEIGDSTLYVLRSANAFDGRIIDNLYPQKTGCSFSTVEAEDIWRVYGGSYIVGVANAFPTVATLCYYAMSLPELLNFNSELMDTQLLIDNGFDATQFNINLQKAWVNPIQYVKTALYIPYQVPTSSSQPLDINGWRISNRLVGTVSKSVATIDINRSFSIPNHPDAATKGVYLNSSPFTVATLTIPPFGCIDLDTSVLANASTVNANIKLDSLTGLGILTVTCNGVVLNRIEAQVGIPISLSQISRDYVGMTTSILGGVAGVAGGAASGNVAGAIGSGVGAVGDAIKSMQPRAQTIGSGGGLAQLESNPRLDLQFFRSVDDDPVHNGRPLCQMRQLSSLGGYMLIQDGDVPINGTLTEATEIKSFLESGIYYE